MKKWHAEIIFFEFSFICKKTSECRTQFWFDSVYSYCYCLMQLLDKIYIDDASEFFVINSFQGHMSSVSHCICRTIWKYGFLEFSNKKVNFQKCIWFRNKQPKKKRICFPKIDKRIEEKEIKPCDWCRAVKTGCKNWFWKICFHRSKTNFSAPHPKIVWKRVQRLIPIYTIKITPIRYQLSFLSSSDINSNLDEINGSTQNFQIGLELS